ncbi:concanavalin A-like lectin/glucanase domain-containing protein [Gigaspora rosea]|uniref:Concanavalin A-like lectin/glucanase domain-containing protein n=1 Tax=Gigaspora rosea TaxID=44941 RepID=A0A397UVS0_9GLOM|nr:concanavalin A-like lectin/glucanase domain-containing protein [Gigaspora rosea]
MDDLKLKTPYNDIVLPTTWDIEEKSPFIDIDSSRLKVDYTNPDDFKAAIVRANHPIPSQCGIFYFEVKIIDKGKNGMIGIGYRTKQSDKKKDDLTYINDMFMPGQKYDGNQEYEKNKRDESWECGYHGDDGYSFCSGDGVPYGPTFTSGDTIGCYLNYMGKIVFYTKNGINLGIACYLPDKFEGILYPCIGFRSQGGSIEVNFGHEKFKYSAMTNEGICNKSKNALVFEHQEKVYFITSRYENELANLTDELTTLFEKETKIEPDNTIALRYKGEINFMMKKYDDSIANLKKLLEIKPNDRWTMENYKLVENYRIASKYSNFLDNKSDINSNTI